jgi:hypothetical protein
MKLKTLFMVLSATLILLTSYPAAATIYSWEDENGNVTFSDDPSKAPGDAHVKIWASDPDPSAVQDVRTVDATASEAIQDEMETTPDEMTEDQESPHVATQGEFAAELVNELGLAKDVGEDAAIDLLTRARIAPPLGEWEPDAPMTPELTVRLRTLTVAATQEGWLSLTPEQALIAFDTTAALLGVAIPTTPGPEVPVSTNSVVDVPPLVYVTPPPPALITYYSWVPFTGGFWWYGTWFNGFFILNDFHFRPFHHHRFFFDTHVIRNRFAEHISDHQFKGGHIGGHPPFAHRRGFTGSSVPPSGAVSPPRTRSRSYLNSPTPPQARIQRGKQVLIQRPAVHSPTTRRPGLSSRPIIKRTPVAPSIRHENRAAPTPSRSFAASGRRYSGAPSPQVSATPRPHSTGHAQGSGGHSFNSGSIRHR